jgi:hypothetical protein
MYQISSIIEVPSSPSVHFHFSEKKNGIEREKICSELMEKFGESNPDVKV